MVVNDGAVDGHQDRGAIAELVRMERWWRDQGDWDRLADAYLADSHVRTTWFAGTGREFAEASREMAEQRARHSRHHITPTQIRIHGDRGLVESLGEIHNRDVLDGVEVDTVQFCRFFSRVVHTPRGWRLASFEGIYQKDTIAPVYPGDDVPIDRVEMSRLRPTYRVWAYMLTRKGYAVPQGDDIIADDRPDLVAAFYKNAERWLDGGAVDQREPK